MASITLPADASLPPSKWLRSQALFVLSAAAVCLIVYLVHSYAGNLGKMSPHQPESIVLDTAGNDVPFTKHPLMQGGPDSPPKFVYKLKADATHVVYPIFFGTDRLRNAEWSGLSIQSTMWLILAFAFAWVAALLAIWKVSKGKPRKVAFGLFLASTLLVFFPIKAMFPLKYNSAAGHLFNADGGELRVGVCTVSIPKTHQEGELESPSLIAFEFRENPDKHIVLRRVDLMSREQFAKELKASANEAPRREGLVFIHGYSNTFEDAARRTAQLVHDMGFEGVPAFYSWPSEGVPQAYTWDSQSVRTTVPHLKEFLETFAKAGDLKTIHVIAHSMGNRCATQVLAGGLDLGQCKIDQCVMAAPDVDKKEFLEITGKEVIRKVGRLTLYASAKDNALLSSWAVNKLSQLGDTRQEICVLDGMDSVDATELDTNFFGHDYFASNRHMIQELIQVIQDRTPVAKRPGMNQVIVTPLTKYWQFKPPVASK